MVKLFKYTVSFSFIVYVAYLLVPLFSQSDDPIVLDLLSWHGYGSIVDSTDVLVFLFLAMYAIATFGMLKFYVWARPFFIALTFISILFAFLSGITVGTPIENVLIYLINLADGAILFMLLFTEIKDKFIEVH